MEGNKETVSHPSHYMGENGIECIDAMVAAFGKESVAEFCKCNAFKYLFRERMKQKGVSIEKAAWYLDKYKEYMPKELWITCVENNAYEVSNKGNVRLKGSDHNRKPVVIKNGYATIMTICNGHPELYYVHRMVANAFLPNPQNLECVNHKDHNRLNNNVENLEWCTTKYNVQHGMGKKVYIYDEEKQLLGCYNSLREVEETFNIPHSSIQRYWLDTNKKRSNIYLYSAPLEETLKQDADKTDKEKEIEDLQKAIWYINDRIEQLKNS